jgi:hypothetical protein
MAIEKIDALLSLTPNAEYVLKNNELTWLSDDITQPTDAEITAEQTRLQAEYVDKQNIQHYKIAYTHY